jgi:hypothetical protein
MENQGERKTFECSVTLKGAYRAQLSVLRTMLPQTYLVNPKPVVSQDDRSADSPGGLERFIQIPASFVALPTRGSSALLNSSKCRNDILVPCCERPVGVRVKEFDDEDSGNLGKGFV